MTKIPGYDQENIEWILEKDITASRLRPGVYCIQERGGDSRQCIITFREIGNDGYARMLFNGVDIETEDYMAYVGLLEQVDNEGPNGEPVEFEAEPDMEPLDELDSSGVPEEYQNP